MAVAVQFLYNPVILESAFSAVILVALVIGGFSEVQGKHMQYSKFFGVGAGAAKATTRTIPSRTAMVSAYFSPFIIGAASFVIYPGEGGLRFLLLKAAITIHFFKRVLESSFLHKYSGGMSMDTWINICVSYMGITWGIIYFHHRSCTTAAPTDPAVDLKWAGLVLFFLGISGNFYHHYLLAKLRSGGGGDRYKIPRGGLFEVVVCPHYLFEILGFLGIACIAQNLYPLAFTLGSGICLCGRSIATRRWYINKFDNFPKHVKALIPYLL